MLNLMESLAPHRNKVYSELTSLFIIDHLIPGLNVESPGTRTFIPLLNGRNCGAICGGGYWLWMATNIDKNIKMIFMVMF